MENTDNSENKFYGKDILFGSLILILMIVIIFGPHTQIWNQVDHVDKVMEDTILHAAQTAKIELDTGHAIDYNRQTQTLFHCGYSNRGEQWILLDDQFDKTTTDKIIAKRIEPLVSNTNCKRVDDSESELFEPSEFELHAAQVSKIVPTIDHVWNYDKDKQTLFKCETKFLLMEGIYKPGTIDLIEERRIRQEYPDYKNCKVTE